MNQLFVAFRRSFSRYLRQRIPTLMRFASALSLCAHAGLECHRKSMSQANPFRCNPRRTMAFQAIF